MFKYEIFKYNEKNIRNDISNGKSITKCSKKYGISRNTLSKYLKNNINEYMITKTYKKFLDNKCKILYLFYYRKYSIKALSKHYNINRSSLREYLKRFNFYEERKIVKKEDGKNTISQSIINTRRKEALLKKYGVENPGQIKDKEMQERKSKKLSNFYKGKWSGEYNPNYGNVIGKSNGFKGYIREDLNQYFRSSWEANFARILDYLNIKWEYEPKRFKINSNETYTPDFYLSDFDLWIEVKGYWFDDAYRKYNEFLDKFPNLKVKVIEEDKYKWLIKRYYFLNLE